MSSWYFPQEIKTELEKRALFIRNNHSTELLNKVALETGYSEKSVQSVVVSFSTFNPIIIQAAFPLAWEIALAKPVRQSALVEGPCPPPFPGIPTHRDQAKDSIYYGTAGLRTVAATRK